MSQIVVTLTSRSDFNLKRSNISLKENKQDGVDLNSNCLHSCVRRNEGKFYGFQKTDLCYPNDVIQWMWNRLNPNRPDWSFLTCLGVCVCVQLPYSVRKLQLNDAFKVFRLLRVDNELKTIPPFIKSNEPPQNSFQSRLLKYRYN